MVLPGGLAGLDYYLVVTGKLMIDTGSGRRVRPLGPFGVQIAAPAATVFAAPYLGRTPRHGRQAPGTPPSAGNSGWAMCLTSI